MGTGAHRVEVGNGKLEYKSKYVGQLKENVRSVSTEGIWTKISIEGKEQLERVQWHTERKDRIG